MLRGFLATVLGLLVFAATPSALPVFASVNAEFIPALDKPVELEVNEGQLIRLQRNASSVFIANPEIADVQVKSPKIVYVFGKKTGETTLYAVDEGGNLLVNAKIHVSHSLERLRRAVHDLLPGNPIQVTSVDGALMVSGQVGSPVDAEEVRRLATRFVTEEDELIYRVRVAGPNQINLRVRITETQREVLKEFGINWDIMGNSGDIAVGLATGNPIVAGGASTIANAATRAQSFATRQSFGQTTTNSLFGAASSGGLDLNSLIDALEEEGLITVLAEPNLTAVSGETASFLAGGEFPVLVPQNENTITIEFKKFGVSLAFTPTILDDSRISLRVRPEVSQLSNNGAVILNNISVPALTTRRAETTVELGSGQTFAIAGLLQNDLQNSVSKFPGLGDLPIIGTLFRSSSFQRNETELAIIVTPYLVRPSSSGRMLGATDGLAMPSDFGRIVEGRVFREQPPEAGPEAIKPKKPRLVGPAGFSMD
ncbi:MAG: type II and III secretion system protein family protein [Alphaproteobacteria bacterium]